MDFKDIKGFVNEKRGFEVAAAGCLPVLVIGGMGAGKTMMAEAMSGITPNKVSIVEGINVMSSGKRLKLLKEGVEDRNNTQYVFTGLPCNCGNFFSRGRTCTCSPAWVRKYLMTNIGVREYIPVQVQLKPIGKEDLTERKSESSGMVLQRVRDAQFLIYAAYGCEAWYITPEQLVDLKLDESASGLLRNAYDKMSMSMGERSNILKIAVTIAALSGKKIPDAACVAEAVQWSGSYVWWR